MTTPDSTRVMQARDILQVDGDQCAGKWDIAQYSRHPAVIAESPLGRFNEVGLRAVLLRRFLLSVHFPARLLARVGVHLGESPWTVQWNDFTRDYAYWSGVRSAAIDSDVWEGLTSGTTILMYHALAYPGERESTYVMLPERFERQMAWLRDSKYRVLSLGEFLDYRHSHRLPPARSVVITFDDGYADNHEFALPILKRYGFPATIFLVSQAVGTTNCWDHDGALADRPLLSWPVIRAMRSCGIEFGAHTRMHKPLTCLPVHQLEEEISGSWADLQLALGEPARAFAYPNGKHDAECVDVVARSGFTGACSSHSGLNDPATSLYLLRRTEIKGAFTMSSFAFAVKFGKTGLISRLRTGR